MIRSCGEPIRRRRGSDRRRRDHFARRVRRGVADAVRPLVPVAPAARVPGRRPDATGAGSAGTAGHAASAGIASTAVRTALACSRAALPAARRPNGRTIEATAACDACCASRPASGPTTDHGAYVMRHARPTACICASRIASIFSLTIRRDSRCCHGVNRPATGQSIQVRIAMTAALDIDRGNSQAGGIMGSVMERGALHCPRVS